MATSYPKTQYRLPFPPRLIFPHTIPADQITRPPPKKRYRPRAGARLADAGGFARWAGFRKGKRRERTVLCREPAWRARNTGGCVVRGLLL